MRRSLLLPHNTNITNEIITVKANDLLTSQKSHSLGIFLSIIICPDNNSHSLSRLLDSFTNQSSTKVETIVVCHNESEDSIYFTELFTKRDSRIKLIKYTGLYNKLTARKIGISRSSGKYCLFLDSGDYFSSNTSLDLLLLKASKSTADIIQFKSIIQPNCFSYSKTVKKNPLSLLRGYYKTTNSLFLSSLKYDNLNLALSTKLLKRSVCLKASDELSSSSSYFETDYSFFFIILCFSKSYYGFNTTPFLSISPRTSLQIKQSTSFNNFSLGFHSDKHFLTFISTILPNSNQNERMFYKLLKTLIINKQIEEFSSLSDSYSAQAFDLFLESPEKVDYIYQIFKKYEYKEHILATKIKDSIYFQKYPKKVKTVAFYYYRLCFGGVEKVLSLIIPKFINLGYRVVLFNVLIDPEKDFPIPPSVIRVKVPSEYSTKRIQTFIDSLRQYEIDLFISDQYDSRMILDIMTVKSELVPFIHHFHGISTDLVRYDPEFYFDRYKCYQLLDKMIVLNHVDENYYRLMGIDCICLPNPIEFDNIDADYSKNEGVILWVGRLDNSKGFMDALQIMNIVSQSVPTAKMIILGSPYSKGSEKALVSFIKKNQLQNKIEWKNHVANPSEYYLKAKIHLMTSQSEGFPMVIAESKSFGIPLVTYSLPYVQLLQDNKGYISVPQRDIEGAAEVIIQLYQNNTLCNILSEEAKESIIPFNDFSHEKAWINIIQSIELGNKNIPEKEIQLKELKLYFETLYSFYKQYKHH